MTKIRSKISKLLPEGFEDLNYVKMLRRSVNRSMKRSESVFEPSDLLPADCTKGSRCNSGICPVCVRVLRRRLIRFCYDHSLHKLSWAFVTVRVPEWSMDAGDFRRFTQHASCGMRGLLDLPQIKNMVATLRRRNHANAALTHAPFLCIGSVEAGIKTIGNVAQPKTFHAHFLVSGVEADVVRECAEHYFGNCRTRNLVNPVRVDPVLPGWANFVSAMTYSYKQPFIKKSFRNAQSREPGWQKPKPREMAEMAYNLGPHKCTERLLLAGIKNGRRGLHLTTNVIRPLQQFFKFQHRRAAGRSRYLRTGKLLK